MSSTFRIELPAFEGPLDLLLHLIRKHELDIMDLPVAFVTERYLDYLALMRELDLDVASEYLLMAATLAHIKSKMLLPAPPSDQDEEDAEQEDPRTELIRRLLEYQKYKEAAERLGGMPIMGRDVFVRGAVVPENEGPAPLAEAGLFKLLDAFEAVLKRLEGRTSFEVTTERVTISARISQLTEMLRDMRLCRFEELFDEMYSRYDVIVTFLAALEMVKRHIARVYQADYGTTIYLRFALLEEETPTIPPAPGEQDGAGSETEDGNDR